MRTAPTREDDQLDELPSLGGSIGTDEEVGTEETLEPELETLDGGEEVGLDDRTAGADFGADDELARIGGDEAERWTDESEAAGDAVEADPSGMIASGGEEYGWTDETEAAQLEEAYDDLSFGGDERLLGPDAGEEGLDEIATLPTSGDGDDAVVLPPLHTSDSAARSDALAEDLDLAEDAHIEGSELSFEDEARLGGADLPEPLDPALLNVEWLGPPDDATLDVVAAREGALAVGEGLYRETARGLRLAEATGMEEGGLTSIAIDGPDAERIAVGTRLSGTLVSEDSGKRFRPANGWQRAREDLPPEVAFFVTAEAHAGGTRLWGRTRSGALFRSDDFGRTWSRPLLLAPIVALTADVRGGVVALTVPSRGQAQLARTGDGGHEWTMRDVPSLARTSDGEAEYHVAALGDALAVACDRDPGGPAVSLDDGESFRTLLALPSPGALAIAEENGAPVLYAALFFEGADRGVVVRHALGSETPDALVVDVRREREVRQIEPLGDAEGDHRVFAIAARAGEGHTELLIASGVGVLRVRVRWSP